MNYYRDGINLDIKSNPKVSHTRDGHVVEKYTIKDGTVGYFVTLSGTHYCAHGASLQQAITDALWKDESKRPSLDSLRDEINEEGTDKRKITLNEFKLLTGACSEGCRIALKREKLDGSPMLLKDIVNTFPEWGNRLKEVLENKD